MGEREKMRKPIYNLFRKLAFLLITFLPITYSHSNLYKKINTKRTLRKNKNIKNLKQKNILFSKTHSKFLNHRKQTDNKNFLIWQAKTHEKFNELIFSWNAKRPEQGFVDFWVSLKHGKKWSPWHKIAEWGANYQLTFANKKNRFVHTTHVRMQTQHNRLAQGFRIKAIFHNDAQKKSLHALFACCSHLKKFRRSQAWFNKPSTMIRGVPKQSQRELNHYRAPAFCSPTCLCMMIDYFHKKIKRRGITPSLPEYAVNFAENVHDMSYLNIYGNWLLNTAQAYDSAAGDIFFRTERLNSFNDIYRRLVNKIPVAVSVRNLKGGFLPYKNGHFLLIIGWDKKNQCVICYDPAFRPSSKILKKYRLPNFLRAWGNSRNLSYIPLPKKHLWKKKI